MEILGAALRVCTDDLNTSIGVYEKLTGEQAHRFDHAGVSVAAVGCFMLMSGPPEAIEVLRKVTATLAVNDVEEARATLQDIGGQVLAGPSATPNGRNLLARHPDGSIFEYVDRRRTA